MGKSVPFSQANLSKTSNPEYKHSCLVDTNFLIALSYEPHVFHEDAKELYDKLVDHDVPIYISLSTRSEFLDFERRVVITEQLIGMLSKTSAWKITSATREKLYAQKVWVDQQPSRDGLPILPDARLKECKKIFSPKKSSGHHGWIEFSTYYLDDLLSRWERASAEWGLNYVGTRETEDSELFQTKVKWKNLYSLSAKTCLSSFDGMLLNLFLSSKFKWLISLDYDLGYGLMAESDPREVLVPDSLYNKHLKKLRF